MLRLLLIVLSPVLWLGAALPAQSREQFVADFNKALELADDKLVDRALKKNPGHALTHYESLYWEKQNGRDEAGAKLQAIQGSWKRCFDNGDTVERLDRWLSGCSADVYQQLQKTRNSSYQLWRHYTDVVGKELVKAEYARVMQQFMELARAAEAIGHEIEIAELWNFAGVVGNKMPERTVTDRRDVVFATEQFLAARKRWNYTFDEHYLLSAEFVKAEKLKIEEAAKADDKRKAEGYDANAKGVESLVMPNVAAEKHPLKFEPLAGWDELDYGGKGGPIPPFWWMVSLQQEGSSRKLDWFSRVPLYLHRTGATKFAIGLDPSDAKKAVEVDGSNKGRVSPFWLDADRKQPYAMVFWTGSEREMVNEAECNLAPSDTIANVYYRSAASWKGQVGAEPIVLYDDNANGKPGDTDPFEQAFKSPMLGAHDTEEGTPAPLLDSMRVGKGPRQPFSEFVKLATGWWHMQKTTGDEIALRPLNPDYVKTGRIKLVWTGPKPAAPVQLVVRGGGDYQTAFFDVAGGKEVEVPATEYTVLWGRMMIGKGARAQVASIHTGSSKPFAVEPGKVHELKMGSPFTLQFTRRGDENASIDALKILLAEASGCVFTDLHGLHVACEVLAAKEADGKGAKAVGKFVRFTDPELVNKAASRHNNVMQLAACFPMPEGYREGELLLKVKLPAAGMKLALSIKKHPLFGVVHSAWQ